MYRLIYIFVFTVCTLATQAQQLPQLKPVLDAQAGNAVIDIPAGAYLLNNMTNGAYQFHNLNNVEIRGNWIHHHLQFQELAFRFLNCTNITVKDLSIDYDPLCFTQGVIVAKDPANLWFEVEIDPGYPVDNVKNTRVQFYDPATRQLKRNSITTGEGHYSAFCQDLALPGGSGSPRTQPGWLSEKVGDLVVLMWYLQKQIPLHIVSS